MILTYITLGIALVALAGVLYILIAVLPQIKGGMEKLGSGLTQIGNKFTAFSDFILSKLPQ